MGGATRGGEHIIRARATTLEDGIEEPSGGAEVDRDHEGLDRPLLPMAQGLEGGSLPIEGQQSLGHHVACNLAATAAIPAGGSPSDVIHGSGIDGTCLRSHQCQRAEGKEPLPSSFMKAMRRDELCEGEALPLCDAFGTFACGGRGRDTSRRIDMGTMLQQQRDDLSGSLLAWVAFL